MIGLSLALACTPASEPEPPQPPSSETAHTGTPFVPTTAPGLVFGSGRPPANVLFVSLDTTRRDRIGPATTPFLHDLLARSVSLEDHRSCSNWTGPSMLCATTGHLPVERGYWPGSQDPSVPGVPEQVETLARLLGDAGFRTHLVTANPVFSPDLAGLGFQDVTLEAWADAAAVRDAGLAAAAELVASAAPWYLHLHFFDPHQPYCPPEAYRDELPSIAPHDVCADLPGALEALWEQGTAEQRDAFLQHVEHLYAGELHAWDDTFAATWADLDALGALDDTLVVFATDHGEQLLERGVLDHSFHLYAEENRAVAAFWAEDLVPAVWAGPTLHEDLAATLFVLYGLAPSQPPSGLPLGWAPEDRVRRLLNYTALESGLYLGIVRGDSQLTWHWSGDYKTLHRDEPQLIDVYDPADPEVAALWVEMDGLIEEVQAAWTHLPEPIDRGP